jgi:hypothetical protein
MCNGKSLSITRNLYQALREIRHPTETTLLWADAICLNQKDESEKRHQVKQIGRVFESAKRVLAWLGTDDEGIAKESFTTIQETVKCIKGLLGPRDDHRYLILESSCPLYRNAGTHVQEAACNGEFHCSLNWS